MDADYNYLYKFILIGDSGVGKTSLIKRYTDKIFQESYVSTIGVDFKIKTIKVNEDIVKLQIWDTAGQERFRSIIASYYRGVHGVIIVFDLCDEESFLNLKTWIEDLSTKVSDKAQLCLIGNKCDQENEIVITDERVKEFIEKMNLHDVEFYKVSAKLDTDVSTFFQEMASKLVTKEKKFGPIFSKPKESFKLKDFEDASKKRFGCC